MEVRAYLHVHLHGVHAQDGVAEVREQIAASDDATEGRHLRELLKSLTFSKFSFAQSLLQPFWLYTGNGLL